MRATIAVLLLIIGCGCQSTYYNTLEKFGVHKREILVDRVEKARNSQEDAKEQFRTALERFSDVVTFEGGELEKNYRRLNSQFEQSKAKAAKVRERISSVKEVAAALFDEWEDELGLYSNRSLRLSSEKQLEQTRKMYQDLVRTMERAADRMNPVLKAFEDQVLFLKHNLNAKAVASLDADLKTMKADIAALIKDMETSIEEANRFIDSMSDL